MNVGAAGGPQVSLAPTHVRWLVGPLVCWLVTLTDFQSPVALSEK